jgi:choice-of-anchor B domain-containing protein
MKSLHYLSQKFFFLLFLNVVILPKLSFGQATGVARFLGNFVSPAGGPYISGCWGWTDSVSGREYALLGTLSGTSIVEITDTDNIIERDFIPGPTSGWREIQTYSHYAYVVSEGGGGTQIIDLSSLPNPVHLVKNFVYKSGPDSTSRAHTIQIRDGYMYLNGCARWAGNGVVIFDLANPEEPAFVSYYTGGHYVHDSFVRNDTMFAAVLGFGLEIVDVSAKAFPQHLFTITYPGSGTHNAATTTDGKYVLTTDEINTTPKTLKIWDLSTPPVFPKVAEYVGDPSTIVHNVFVKDSLAIMSYYKAGVKIVNIVDPTAPFEIGGYDTYPDSLGGGQYNGAWSVYPFFPSGKIIIGVIYN